MSGDVIDMYRGYRLPDWWTAERPPWATEHDWAWYVERAQVPGAVHAAAELAAAATVAIVPER